VNRGEDRLVYIRQSAPGIGAANTTLSMPEVRDLRAASTTIDAFGDFSTVDFTLTGFGEPRVVKAGVVNGSYFEVMGLRPVLGRLLNPADDGPAAAPAVVLTHRFWTSEFHRDRTVIGKPIRLGPRSVTVVGVLEPCVPYPADTEIIANVVTSPHHLGATMVNDRAHRMTELFGRLAAGASVENARAELIAAHAAILREHPETYSARAQFHLSVTPLREQITAPARTILLLLLAGAAVVFVIACSNVANLILARSVRREGELAVRAALGASRGALRRTLLAESLALCAAGALLGVALAQPLVAVVSRFAARFSVRALEVSVDGTVLWMGTALAIGAAVLLAYVPRLPSSQNSTGFGLASGSIRITPGTNRRLRLFATTQIAFAFVLLAGAGTLVAALVALQAANTGYDTRQVLALDVPRSVGDFGAQGNTGTAGMDYREVARRIGELPGVEGASFGSFVPWRDVGQWPSFQFTVDGYTPADGEESPHARPRFVGPGFFGVVGIPMIAGRDFTYEDRQGSEPVVMVSQSIARRFFPNGDALDRTLWARGLRWPGRIVGVVGDVDDENVVGGSAMTLYYPFLQRGLAGRLFVRTSTDPYPLVPAITRIIRELSVDQPVERAATLADVRAEVLTPERLNAFVLSGFGGVALLIAAVGVLAFSVSARTREFGVRLAIGSTPRHLMRRVLLEGATIAAIGIAAGTAGAYAFKGIAASYLGAVSLPGLRPLGGAAILLVVAAVVASSMPAARAARVDVLEALRSE
jgi:putative ABC transport system permease protein